VLIAGCGDQVTGSAESAPRGSVAGAASVELVTTAAARAEQAPTLTMRTSTSLGDSATVSVLTRSNADGSRVSMVTETPSGPAVEARGVDGTFYVRLPEPLGGAEWVVIDPSELGPAGSGAVDRFVDQDPRIEFRRIAELADEVTEVGRDEVQGVPVTRYRVTVDLAGVAELDEPGQALRGLQGIDVWVDDQGYLRQARYELDGASIDMPGMPLVIESTVVSYDDPVDVEAPPAASTVPFGQLLGEGGLGALAEVFGGGN
jgi:hypothetical protein